MLSYALKVTKRAFHIDVNWFVAPCIMLLMASTTNERVDKTLIQLLFGVLCVQSRRIRNARRLTVNGAKYKFTKS